MAELKKKVSKTTSKKRMRSVDDYKSLHGDSQAAMHACYEMLKSKGDKDAYEKVYGKKK